MQQVETNLAVQGARSKAGGANSKCVCISKGEGACPPTPTGAGAKCTALHLVPPAMASWESPEGR